MSARPSTGNGRGCKPYDIDQATEEFRKRLDADTDMQKKVNTHPSVTGGLPPHLLRQQNEMTPTSASAVPRPDRHGSGVSPESAAFGQDYSGSSAQKPLRIAAVASTQRKTSGGRSLMYSRWATGNNQQVLAQEEQTQKERRVVAPAAPYDGVRLSVNAYSDWSAFQHGQGPPGQNQQQQFIAPEPLVVESQKKQWRPKHSCDLDSQDLLESCSSSLVYSNDDSVCNFDADGARQIFPTQDVRGAMAADLDLVPKVYGQGFKNKNAWNDYPEDPEKRDSKWRPTYCQLWVKDMENCEWPVAKFLGIPDMQHEQCDVQTSNAWLMAPVDYPGTHINPEDVKMAEHNGTLARRLEGHVNLKLRANFEKITRRVEEREGEQLWEGAEDNAESKAAVRQSSYEDTEKQLQAMELQMQAIRLTFAAQSSPQPVAQPTSPIAQPTPPPTHSNSRRNPIIIPGKMVWHPVYGDVFHEPRVIEDTDPPTFLKVPCFLRPAEANDLAQILEIYNWEVNNGLQALDTRPLSLDDLKRLFKRCDDCKTPMIVTVAGRCSESAARKKADAEPAMTQPWEPQEKSEKISRDKIIGFAFVSIMSSGLSGDVHRNVDRFQGEVHVYVAKESRRNGVGRALLQQIMVICSRLARVCNDDFKWHDPDKSIRYEDAFYNVRNYARLYIKFASRGKADPEQEWMSKFLDSENFLCISTMDKSRKVVYNGDGDRGKMLDTLLYQHDCQNPDEMKENVYY